MDIVIKSFNRPYYLDRCLFSIQNHVINDGIIYILDDGTPQKYLEKIKTKYPKVVIKKSTFYNEKIQFTSQGKKPSKYKIPIDFWVESIRNCSDNFVLIEDDTWFIEDVNLNNIEVEMDENNVMMTKLYWIGNEFINQNKNETILKDIILLKPKLSITLPFLYNFVFYKFDKFKIRKTLRFLNIHTDEKHLAYYTIYAVAGMIFNKKYFISLWDNHENKIDEGLQLYNAVKELKKSKGKLKFARHKKEVLRTGFVSSATNQHKENFEGNIDMFKFNKLLNEAWYNAEFEVINSLPNEIEEHEVFKILQSTNEEKISFKDWTLWKNVFKKRYISIGCKIDY